MGKELVKIPGLIDVHTHCRQPGSEHKETFETASAAAVAGGFTTILDMPNSPIPTTTVATLQQKLILAGHHHCDIGFHFGVTEKNLPEFDGIKRFIFGFKLYMNHTTGDLLVDNPDCQEGVFYNCPPNKIVMVHAEGEMMERAIRFAEKYTVRLHICHVSLAQQLGLIKKHKATMPDLLTAEVTPHHLFLTYHDENALGPFAVMKPGLGSQKDQEALWEGLRDGTIDMIASDHAPHTKEEKIESTNVPFGVPGLETTLPLMLTALNRGKIELEGPRGLLALLHYNPMRIFQIPNQPRTYTVVNLSEKHTLSNGELFTKCGWTPFDGFQAQGKVVRTVLRNKIVFDEGRVKNVRAGQLIFPVTISNR